MIKKWHWLFIVCFLVLSGCDNQTNQIEITFFSNGGTMIENIVINSSDDTITLPTPIKEGFTFAGWYLELEGSEQFSIASLQDQKSINLYAKWTMDVQSITITFQSNGGTLIQPITQISGGSISLDISSIKEGYDFLGWYLDQSLTNQVTIDTLFSENTTLHARWSIKTYVVIFHLDGGIVVTGDAVQSVEHGNSAAPPTVSKDGHTYTWSGNYTQVVQNVDVFAIWEATIYTISFDTQGGNTLQPLLLGAGATINLSNLPIRDGFEFAGWYESVGSTNEFSQTIMPSSNIVLYADWSSVGLLFVLMEGDQTYEVSSGEFSDYELVQIPKKYNNKYVIKISNYGFRDCAALETIIIPETITHIGNFAFLYNSSLVTIELPNSLEQIGSSAFRFCYQLMEFQVGQDSEYFMVQDGILYSKNGKTLVKYPLARTDEVYTINNTVEIVGDNAFAGNKNLTQIIFGSSVHTIKNYAFYDCAGLTSIEIPNHIEIIEYMAFRDCAGLISVTLGTGIVSIESYLFQNCNELTSIIIPAGIRNIRYGAFYDCRELEFVTIIPHTSGAIVEGSSFMFANTHPGLKIYVGSENLVTSYKANYYWASYINSIVVSP